VPSEVVLNEDNGMKITHERNLRIPIGSSITASVPKKTPRTNRAKRQDNRPAATSREREAILATVKTMSRRATRAGSGLTPG
jgi:hypothetical protein